MAKITLAIATTHGPQLHTTPEQWLLRLPADRAGRHPFRDRTLSFDDLVALRADENLAVKSSPEGLQRSHARCHAAMDRLAVIWADAGADAAIIFGNDQQETFNAEFNPSFFVFCGDAIPNHPMSDDNRAKLPPGIREAEFGHATRDYVEYPGLPELGLLIAEELSRNDFDVAVSRKWPAQAINGASHAFGHIYRRVMRDRVIPNVPIYQNTFFPPNQPSARRAYEFGRVVRRAVRNWPSDMKIAVFASGGMSHFVIDEEFDRTFVAALASKDKDFLTRIPLSRLQSGTSELKSWITLAGFLEDDDATMNEIDYVPCYRSAAGTGTANGFYWWRF